MSNHPESPTGTEPRKRGRPAKTHDEVAGTNGGYYWHKKRSEAACRPCSVAHAAWSQQYKKDRAAAKREAGRVARLTGRAKPTVKTPMEGIEW